MLPAVENWKNFKTSIQLISSVEKFCKNLLGVPLKQTGFLVAFSTGLDSTALLVLLSLLREKNNIRLVAANLNHGLREESREEAEYAQALCSFLQIPLYTCRVDIKNKSLSSKCGLEECGRRERYIFLEQCRKFSGMEWIVTAHHIGDLAEDILMRLSRGTAWPGLGGMRAVLPERHILRPLLLTEKSALYSFLKNNNIQWHEDPSNNSTQWKRNRIRKNFLPLFFQENPQFYHVIRTLWKTARDDEMFWQSVFEKILQWKDDAICISRKNLYELGRAGRLRVFAESVRRFATGQPRADTLENMESAWKLKQFPKYFSFHGGIKAAMTGDGIKFFKKEGR